MSDTDTSVETRIRSLEVENSGAESHTVYALLVEDGDPVYWDSTEVGADSDDQTETGSENDTGVFEDHPTETASGVLYAWRDDQPRSEWRRHDFSESDDDCLAMTILVDHPTTTADLVILSGTPPSCRNDDADDD